MKNILYIGPYREASSVGNASRKYIKALNATKNNITIKPFYNIWKSYADSLINTDILQLENNTFDHYDIVIQHVYPHQLSYNNKFEKNIAIVHPECLNYGLDYINYINQMDTIIVPSEFSKRSLVGTGIDQTKIVTVPVPLDLIEIDSFKNIMSNKDKTNQKYVFYIIDKFASQSNIEKTILAFLILSSKYENIELVLNIEPSFHLNDNIIKENIYNIYNMFSTNQDNMPTIINGDIEYSKLLDIHNNGDCLIDISSGKSFGYSSLEAMIFNNNIIALNDTAQSELLSNNCGSIIDNEYANCLDDNKSFFMYNTVRQTWSKPILNDLINTMEKTILESDTAKINRIKSQDSTVQSFSIKNISELLENIL